MNTMIGFTARQDTDSAGKVLQSLLLLLRNFLSSGEGSIQSRHVWNSQQFMQDVPPRVWKRHSALLTLLAHQADMSGAHQYDAE
jgi:hypothetical protein